MSKGLSKQQRILLRLLKKRGYLDVKTAWNALAPAPKEKDEAARLLIERFREAFWKPSETRNANSVYRALASLTERGDIAQLIGTRHAIWIAVEKTSTEIKLSLLCRKCIDKDGKDVLDIPSGVMDVISRGKPVRFRCQDFVCTAWEKGDENITDRFRY